VVAHVPRQMLALLDDPVVAIGTPVALITRAAEADGASVVKLVGSPIAPGRSRALYFTRARAPWGEGALYHDIGLYASQRPALKRLIRLPPSALEQREKLEQVRVLEAGVRIDATLVEVPLGVDTPEDLERARLLLMALMNGEEA